MSDYDAAFASAVGGGNPQREASPYDAIMEGLTPKKAVKVAPLASKDEPTGIIDAMAISAGRRFDKLGAGLQQMYYGARGNAPELQRLEEEQAEKTRLFAPLQAERPIATGIGDALPLLATGGVGGAGLGAIALRAGIAGAVPEALSYGSLKERAQNAALAGAGGAAGGALGYGAGKAIQSFGRAPLGQMDDAAMSAAAKLQQNGIPVRPDQATGSRFLQNANAALDNLPFTSGMQQQFRAGQQDAFNNAAGQFIGRNGPLDDAARLAAKKSIGAQYTAVAARNEIPQKNLLPALDDIGTTAKEAYSPRVEGWADQILARVDPKTGALSGKNYKELDSKLGAAMKGGGPDVHYIGEIRKRMREAMGVSVRKEDQGLWAKLDSEYSALGAISKSVDESGNVSAKRLFSNTRDKSIARVGRGELGELASAARKIIPDAVPNSGTAQRLAMQTLLSGGGFGAGYLASGGDWEKAGMGAAAGLSLPLLARAALNHPGILSLAKPKFSAPNAIRPLGGLLGAGAGYAAPGLLFPATGQ